MLGLSWVIPIWSPDQALPEEHNVVLWEELGKSQVDAQDGTSHSSSPAWLQPCPGTFPSTEEQTSSSSSFIFNVSPVPPI